jgi:hypothetical protein
MFALKITAQSNELAKQALEITAKLIDSLKNDLKDCPYPKMRENLTTQIEDATNFYNKYKL